MYLFNKKAMRIKKEHSINNVVKLCKTAFQILKLLYNISLKGWFTAKFIVGEKNLELYSREKSNTYKSIGSFCNFIFISRKGI